MDQTQRKITKIAREAGKFTARILKAEGIGTSEFDFIHTVRKNPGITQAGIIKVLGIDKGAAARQAANLVAKGYLVKTPNPTDKRSSLLFATDKAKELKNSKAQIESIFYEWLTEPLNDEELNSFVRLLDKLYLRCKNESNSGFSTVKNLIIEK